MQTLRDKDVTMDTEKMWKRINTLKNYGIRNGALFRLVRRKEHPGQAKVWGCVCTCVVCMMTGGGTCY